jgi:hypothetical protein
MTRDRPAGPPIDRGRQRALQGGTNVSLASFASFFTPGGPDVSGRWIPLTNSVSALVGLVRRPPSPFFLPRVHSPAKVLIDKHQDCRYAGFSVGHRRPGRASSPPTPRRVARLSYPVIASRHGAVPSRHRAGDAPGMRYPPAGGAPPRVDRSPSHLAVPFPEGYRAAMS